MLGATRIRHSGWAILNADICKNWE